MPRFFEDVGNFITAPIRTVYDIATGNEKYNSLGDIWNNATGDSNALAKVTESNPINQLYEKATGGDIAKSFQLPSWDELGKPAQAFSSSIDTQNQALPSFIQPYAQPIEAAVLSAFNPLAGAAYNTAYQAGQNQAQPGAFDWGTFGKDAAINFGTAAATMGANSLVSNANNAAQASKDASTLSSFNAATNQASGTSSALSSTAANAARNTQGALNAFNPSAITPAMTLLNGGVGTVTGASVPTFSNASALQSSGANIGDFAYKTAVNTSPKLVNSALTATLAPAGATAISGASPLDSFGSNQINTPATHGMQWGDLLNAFGGDEGNTPNPNGPRYDETAINNATSRLAANNYLQQTQARDSALPAGQYQASQNTPYANRLDEINKGTDQSYQDLRSQIDNANNYYGVLDTNSGLTSDQLNTYLTDPNSINDINNANKYYSIMNNNPGLTSDQLDTYLKDPSSGVLGNFSVPAESAGDFNGLITPTLPNDFFQPGNIYAVPPNADALAGIRPLGPMNMSLL